MNLKHNFRSLFHRSVISGPLLIKLLIDEFHPFESLHNEGNDDLDRVFSERLADTNPFPGQERHETHWVMFAASLEPLRSKLIVVLSPLVLQVMQFVNVCHHHLVGSDVDASYVDILGDAEARTHLYRRIDPECFVNNILQVVIAGQVKALYR